MADLTNKYVDSVGVKYLWNKANDTFLKKESGKGLSDENFTAEEKEKLASLENYELPAASADTMGGIIIGDGLEMDENGVVHTVYNPEMDVMFEDITGLPTTLDGYGITDAVTKDDLEAAKEEIKEETAKAIHYVGQVETFEDLEAIENPENGAMYDVKEDGMNWAWSESDNRWDNLGTIVKIESLSNYELDIITGSATSEEALRAIVEEGGDVELCSNLALTQPVVITKDTVLDLNGFELSGNMSGYALVADGASLTLRGGNVNLKKRIAQAQNGGEVIVEEGNYESGDVAFSAIGEGSKIVVEEGTIVAVEGGVGAFDNAEIEINGGTITGIDNFAIFTNGTSGRGGNTIVMNGGELVGNITSNGYESCGVYIANNDTFVMNGGTIVSNNGCGILMRAGNVTINDGEVTAKKGDHSPGWVGDNKTKMTASAVIYHESANYPGKEGMSLTINGGKFVGADHALEVLSGEAHPNVTVTGGTFIPAINL